MPSPPPAHLEGRMGECVAQLCAHRHPQASLNLRQCFQHPERCMLIPILQMGKLRLAEEK